ncbi:hypothetical protein CVT24_007251 [Panaeolus cyanescens]|uniref:G domain-containing protein n=1 Tax=Panaeolus cyanescens TaxID=181874 RepID=A0A409YWJ3_9AGAR|nr:hypothetical protein CVT24_007251 [Panaeolus cyanescens]
MPYSVVRTGDVTIERCSEILPPTRVGILLLGGTGSGKSSFIEALAGSGRQLGISGGTLESVTQEVQAFKVVNVHVAWSHGDFWPIYLVDTPGFLDSKMSELEVLSKVNAWREQNGQVFRMHYVFYFCRITDTRLPGSAHRLMQIIKNLGALPSGVTVAQHNHPQFVKYHYLLDAVLASQQFRGAIEDSLASLHIINISRRLVLLWILNDAKNDFIHAYANLRIFGTPSGDFSPFTPNVPLRRSDLKKLDKLERQLKRQ